MSLTKKNYSINVSLEKNIIRDVNPWYGSCWAILLSLDFEVIIIPLIRTYYLYLVYIHIFLKKYLYLIVKCVYTLYY